MLLNHIAVRLLIREDIERDRLIIARHQRQAVSGDRTDGLDTVLLFDDLGNLSDHRFGLLIGRILRHRHGCTHLSGGGHTRNEFHTDFRHHKRGKQEQRKGRTQRHQTVMQTPFEHDAVPVDKPVKQRMLLFCRLFEQRRAHRRNNRQCDDQRCHQRVGNRQSHIREQLTCQSFGEYNREEHADGRERRGKNRTCDLACAAHRRFRSRHTLIAQTVDILDDNDGVVNQHADAERQTGQGDHVQRDIGEIHQHDGKQNAHRDAEGNDRRRTHIAQEQKQDDNGEQAAQKQILQDTADNHLNIIALIHQRRDVKIRIALLQILNLLVDQLGDLRGGCRRGFGEGQQDRVVSVDQRIGVLIVILGGVADGCDIVQPDIADPVQIHRKQQGALELFERVVLFADLQNVLFIAA